MLNTSTQFQEETYKQTNKQTQICITGIGVEVAQARGANSKDIDARATQMTKLFL